MIGQDGKPKKMMFLNKLNQFRLMDSFKYYIPHVEEHFNCAYFGTHSVQFEWYPENTDAGHPKSDGYAQTSQGWARHKEIDLTGILWLNEYNTDPEFDPRFECYGGKLEFPTFDISFKPERGTLIIFPVVPNFIHAVEKIHSGSLTQARFTIRTEVPYQYNPNNFNLNIESWNM